MSIETLTDEERAQVCADEYEGQTITPKMLRCIDQRDALLKERDAEIARINTDRAAIIDEKVRSLTERDAEIARLKKERHEWRRCQDNWRESSNAKVARLTTALAAAERDSVSALNAVLTRLEAAEQKLAAAEKQRDRNMSWEPLHDAEQARADAAEQKLAAAESTIERWKEGRGATETRVRALESELVQLRERVHKAMAALEPDWLTVGALENAVKVALEALCGN